MAGQGRPIRKLIAGTLAVLVSVQPAVALNCPCHCTSEITSAARETHARACHHESHHHHHAGAAEHECHGNKHHCHHAHGNLAEGDFHNGEHSRGSAPCQCPNDCGCQLRSPVGIALSRNSEDDPRASQSAVHFPGCVPIHSHRPPHAPIARSLGLTALRIVSAQAVCAAL